MAIMAFALRDRNRCSFVVLLALVVAVALRCVEASPISEKKFAVIVDAGSSGSRIFVYRQDKNKLVRVVGDDGKPWSYKKKPGISTLAGMLDSVEPYILDLLQHLKDELPESKFPRSAWAKTPFMWFATAGMRLLPSQQADQLTYKIRQIAHEDAAVPFYFQDRWARTLSGEEEGAFAWISLNYRQGFFDEDESSPTPGSPTDIGVVETGGASTQMTFLSNGDILSNKFNVIINKKLYPLYTHSFLGFGLNEITRRIFTNECLCKQKNKNSHCKPCIGPEGYKIGTTVTSACLLKDYAHTETLTVEGKRYDVSFVGSGDPAQCAVEMDFLFRPDYTCFTRPCSFAGIYQPPFGKDKQFYGVSAILYTVRDLGVLASTRETTWPTLMKATEKFCRSDKSAAKGEHDWRLCLAGTFVAKELQHFRFSRDHAVTIDQFGTWTIGAVLYQLELMEIVLPDDAPS